VVLANRSRLQAVIPLAVAVVFAVVLGTQTASAHPLAQNAKPRVIKLNWVEQRSATYFPIAMTFKVKDVTLTRKAWSLRASFTNRSKKAIRISRKPGAYYAAYSFGLGVPEVRTQPGFTSTGLRPLKATYAKPALPQLLRAGQTWSGLFGGPGLPARGKLINVTFGVFSVPGEKEWSWVTNNSFKL
jgi:hypothetical protein